MNLAELVIEIDRREIGKRLGTDERTARRYERQFEYFDFGEAAGRQTRRGPNDIGVAVARLVEQGRRRAAQLHRRKNIDAKPPARFGLDLTRPGHQELVVSP